MPLHKPTLSGNHVRMGVTGLGAIFLNQTLLIRDIKMGEDGVLLIT
jgi:hypothetical protein